MVAITLIFESLRQYMFVYLPIRGALRVFTDKMKLKQYINRRIKYYT